MHNSRIIVFLSIFIFSFLHMAIGQDVEVQGKLKVTNTELNNTADSVAVRLSDGTLGIREKSTLSEGLE